MKSILFILLSMCCIFSACTRNDDIETEVLPLSETICLNVSFASSQQILSYATGVVDENKIESADALVFDAVTHFYLYSSKAQSITGDGDSKSMKIRINEPVGADPTQIYIVLIANASNEIATAISNQTISTTKTYEQIMANLTFASSGKWAAITDAWTAFPMWGVSNTIDLEETVTSVSLSLLRSVAKINVGLNFNNDSDIAQGLGNKFILTSVELRNARNKLSLAPKASLLAGTTVTAPTVPTDAVAGTSAIYTVSDKKSCVNQIYLGESATDDNPHNNVCIIIGGKWSATDIEGSDISYYRIDFVKNIYESDVLVSQQYLPILRNHVYKVTIKNVGYAGYSTPDAAFAALGVNTNLAVNVEENNLAITDIISNGQYFLGVREYLSFMNLTLTNQPLIIETNYPLGCEISSLPSWITKPANYSPTAPSINLQRNPISQSREAEIVVTAGLLQRKIRIRQT